MGGRGFFRGIGGFGAAAIMTACGAKTAPPQAAEGGSPSATTSASASAPPVPGGDAGAPSAQGGDGGACPTGMVLVEGSYCTKVSQTCLRWLDPPGPYRDYRCAEYKKPAECVGPREKKRFCIDKEEYVPPGETLPLANQSWTTAGEVCEKLGRRLCLESEWQFACEGEEMHPYPYGNGFVRDGSACNIDRANLGKPNGGLADLRAPISDYPRCLSPFGVHDMSGNIEEWATQDDGKPPERSTMKGAWWLPGKNTCRARTVGHGEIYRGKQVGVRCCRDAE